MLCLSIVSVDEAFIEAAWQRVSSAGSYYSIGDGASHETFRRMLFQSVLVVKGEGFIIRVERHADCVELHPIVFGHALFRNAATVLAELTPIIERLFAKTPICCIIPDGMRGAKRLVRIAGFAPEGAVQRNLSGVMLRCSVFVKRSTS